jgi:hypothetical protein
MIQIKCKSSEQNRHLQVWFHITDCNIFALNLCVGCYVRLPLGMWTGHEAYMNAYSCNRSVVMGSRHFGLTAHWSSEVINNRIHETQWQTLRRGRKWSLITLDKLSQIGSLFHTELMAINIWLTMYSLQLSWYQSPFWQKETQDICFSIWRWRLVRSFE